MFVPFGTSSLGPPPFTPCPAPPVLWPALLAAPPTRWWPAKSAESMYSSSSSSLELGSIMLSPTSSSRVRNSRGELQLLSPVLPFERTEGGRAHQIFQKLRLMQVMMQSTCLKAKKCCINECIFCALFANVVAYAIYAIHSITDSILFSKVLIKIQLCVLTNKTRQSYRAVYTKWCYVKLSTAKLPTIKMSTSSLSPSKCRHHSY
jgi:hypothetical protein